MIIEGGHVWCVGSFTIAIDLPYRGGGSCVFVWCSFFLSLLNVIFFIEMFLWNVKFSFDFNVLWYCTVLMINSLYRTPRENSGIIIINTAEFGFILRFTALYCIFYLETQINANNQPTISWFCYIWMHLSFTRARTHPTPPPQHLHFCLLQMSSRPL